jgi:hypothetical protein
MPLVIWFIPVHWMRNVTVEYFTVKELFNAGSLTTAVCLSRHIRPLKEYLDEKNA